MKRRKTIKTAIAATFAFGLLATCFVTQAGAQCAALSASNVVFMEPESGLPQFMQASFAEKGSEADHIVGFWKGKFTAMGNSGGPPDGTVIDNQFVQWHSDGTEITNSMKAPVTGNFCMGIWHRTGKFTYELNHFALAYDTNNNFVGTAQIQEDVTLDQKADQYSGTFKIVQYDPEGNVLAEVLGNVTAKRITVDTTINQVL